MENISEVTSACSIIDLFDKCRYNIAMEKQKTVIRHVQSGDKTFWYTLDRHLPEEQFCKKVSDRQGYVILADNRPVGILRYNLFWDNTPFCNLLYITPEHQGQGYGKKLTEYWEREMRSLGYNWLLVSTRSDESSQHFYRSLGYADCGTLLAPDQPAELFLSKYL